MEICESKSYKDWHIQPELFAGDQLLLRDIASYL